MTTIEDVKKFWETNPLWVGESKFEPCTRQFFEEHRKIIIEDCLAGRLDERCFPKGLNKRRVLDLGCGPGFWTIELARRGCQDIVAADLTERALELVRRRCQIYGVVATVVQQNAENLTFKDKTFTHVNCQGVIHHTPDTEKCIKEIARVLVDNGTASLSVYYRNIYLRTWPILKWAGKVISKMGGGMSGRGREKIYEVKSVNEIVRLYDGKDNPMGKCYTMRQVKAMFSPYFIVRDVYFHLFPARSLPFRLPQIIHRYLDVHTGFLVYVNLEKR